MTLQRLPASWEPLDAVLMVWPHADSTWGWLLEDAVQLYEALASVICDYADIVIVAPETQISIIQANLAAMEVPVEHVYCLPMEGQGSWVKDIGPLVLQCEQSKILLTPSDSGLVQYLHNQGVFPNTTVESPNIPLNFNGFESDGAGSLLVSTLSLLPTGGDVIDKESLEPLLKSLCGVSRVNWLDAGYIPGEGGQHLNVLARCCPDNLIVYTACDDDGEDCFDALKDMEKLLSSMVTAEGMPYRLLPLPWPGAKFNDNNERILASYASFLVVNEAVLVPLYNSPFDEDALDVIAQAFPGKEIFGIPAEILAEAGGHLLRIVTPLPEGVLFL